MSTPRVILIPALFLACDLVLVAVWGCGKWQTAGLRGGQYEIAWVDPQIIVSDSSFTLIRAERIDSFLVDRSSDFSLTKAPSVMFHVTDNECFTSVNLLSSTGEVIMPLLVRNLSRGYYKLTVDVNRLPGECYRTDHFFLKAEYCGSSVTQPIRPRRVK